MTIHTCYSNAWAHVTHIESRYRFLRRTFVYGSRQCCIIVRQYEANVSTLSRRWYILSQRTGTSASREKFIGGFDHVD